MTDQIGFSGTVLAVMRISPELIKVTIRETKGNLYDLQLPFSQEQFTQELPFNLDDMVNINISKIGSKNPSETDSRLNRVSG
jgi:hypothetical protein